MATYTPNPKDLRAWNTFDPASQKLLLSGGTVTAGDKRQFVLIDGHATVVGSDSYKAAMALRQGTAPQGPGHVWNPGSPPGSAPGTTTATPVAQTDPGPDLAQNNTIAALTEIFKGYGLESLVPAITSYVKQGYDAQTVSLLLQETPEYKQRFAGNELRKQNGLAVLSPAEYLAAERAYTDVARAYGLPKSFYDNPSDFAQLIGSDLSPDEFRSRAADAFKYVQSGNPEARQMLRDYYGLADDAHVAAYFLDPARAQAVIDRQSRAVDIGAAAQRQGMGIGRDQAERYADLGVTQQQAEQGFSEAAQVLPDEQTIARRFGSDYTANDAADEFVTGLASAKRKRDLLNQQEQALFAGQEGNVRAFSTDATGAY